MEFKTTVKMSIKNTALKFYLVMYLDGRGGGLVVSALDSGVSGPGSSAGLGHSVVFLGKTHFTLYLIPVS